MTEENVIISVENLVKKYGDFTAVAGISFEVYAGEIFGLLDPTDPIRNSGSGIARYLYSKDELSQMLNLAGFEVIEVPHYYENDYFSLVGTKSSGL